MNIVARVVVVGVLSVAFLGMAGCSSSKSRVGGVLNLDTDLKLTFIAEPNINPDDNKNPSPVFVRFYELKSPLSFHKADFIDIYERDKEVLGNDFIAKQTLRPIKPGDQRTERFVLQSGTRYIALYAEFSQYPGSVFKAIFPVTENNVIKNKATVQLSGTRILLIEEKR